VVGRLPSTEDSAGHEDGTVRQYGNERPSA
jgi:hypothetical protein